MSNKKAPKHQNQEVKKHDLDKEVGEVVIQSEHFIETYKKPLLITLVAVILVVSGIIAFQQFVLVPRAAKADVAMFKGQQYFEQDSFKLALNGDGAGYIGFQNITKEYSMTPAADLACAYAGLCQKELGNYKEAIEELKRFDGDDMLIAPAITGAIGDCYAEIGELKEAISYYQKAAKADNDFSPFFLKKAGIASESLKDWKGAIAFYTQIKDQYPTSAEASDIDKYIEVAKTK